ncbi:MAG: C25 family cysteine peptidase [Chloroflexota bacterium]
MKQALLIGGGLLLLLGVAAAFFIFGGSQPDRGSTVDQLPPDAEVVSGSIKILINEDGVYRLTPDDLAAAGLALTELNSDDLQLRQGKTAVPFLIHNNSFVFYGQATDDPYTPVRPYILETGQNGTVINEQPVTVTGGAIITEIPQTIHFEENSIYAAEARDSEHDYDLWLWQDLPQQTSYDLALTLPTISNRPATLRSQFRGVTYNREIENDHDVDLVVNEQRVDTIRFDGQTYFTGSVDIPSNILQMGDNTIQFDNTPEGASFLDIVQLNWVELTYFATPTAVNDFLQFRDIDGTLNLTGFSNQPLLLEISDPATPKLLTDWPYASGQAQLTTTADMVVAAVGPLGFQRPLSVAPVRDSQWRDSSSQADLIIISSDTFAPALAPLVEAREAEGLSVALVAVEEVYDAFGDGVASPASIQSFVRHAHAEWAEPKPSYLFIVGDATTDYHNNFGTAPEHAIPSMLVPVVFSGETVSDSRLVDVDDDMMPDMAIGRWPVSTVAEVESLVARTLAYEQGDAAEQILFATDGTEPQFPIIAERLSEQSDFSETAVNILDGPQADQVAAAWNEGTWLTTYVGHGSVTQWGKEDVFTLDAVSNLSNSSPPIVVQLTCLTGLFAHPQQTSLSEVMLTHDQGPVLLVAATSLTLSSHQEPFAASLFQNLQDPQIERVGDAFQNAKLSLDVSNDGLREISDTFALFGDPSAHIVRPES